MNNKIKPLRLFVAGTDTGIGKTVLSLLLMQYFYERGFTPFYIKPAQTGCCNVHDQDSDARFIYEHVKALFGQNPADSMIYCFKNPKAPYFAARDEAQEIDFSVITAAVEAKSAAYSPLIIEGSGGIFVPVTEKLMVIDMIQITKAKTIIAARAGLGTINHTLLTLEALRRRSLAAAGIILLAGEKEAAHPEIIRENMEAIEKFSGIKVGGVIGNITDFSKPSPECYAPLDRLKLL
ncbi:MAG: dethiobiotin synthase [Syntrophaceae bacterium]|nr:dethiobiotin synthase [Syntrophaceae bacterium]